MKNKFEVTREEITNPIELNQEQTRTWIVKRFFSFIGIIILGILLAFIFLKELNPERSNLLITIFTSFVGLAGTIIGFYFGKNKT